LALTWHGCPCHQDLREEAGERRDEGRKRRRERGKGRGREKERERERIILIF
jgi:hypothetical protein